MYLSFFYCSAHHRDLHSFPTRRSSDLAELCGAGDAFWKMLRAPIQQGPYYAEIRRSAAETCRQALGDERFESYRDRKSTRLNSSHTVISYAVFCLKKKKKKETTTSRYT